MAEMFINMDMNEKGELKWDWPTWQAKGEPDENGNCLVEIPDDIFLGLKDYIDEKRFSLGDSFKLIVKHPGQERLDEHPLLRDTYKKEILNSTEPKEYKKIKKYFDFVKIFKENRLPLGVLVSQILIIFVTLLDFAV